MDRSIIQKEHLISDYSSMLKVKIKDEKSTDDDETHQEDTLKIKTEVEDHSYETAYHDSSTLGLTLFEYEERGKSFTIKEDFHNHLNFHTDHKPNFESENVGLNQTENELFLEIKTEDNKEENDDFQQVVGKDGKTTNSSDGNFLFHNNEISKQNFSTTDDSNIECHAVIIFKSHIS